LILKDNTNHSFFARILVCFVTVTSLCLAASYVGCASGLYVFENMWGTPGSANGQFNQPYDAAVFSSGSTFPSINVFVADQLNHRIQKFHMSNPCPAGTTQVVAGVCFVTKWGTQGSGPGQFNQPRGISLDPSGNVFVADTGNHRIQKFTNTGAFIREWGQLGGQNGQLRFPNDVAVDRSGNVFVADTGNNRTQKFTNTGAFIRTWGTTGTGDGQFQVPNRLDVDNTGNVFVSDGKNHRIQKFTNTGSFLTKTLSSDLRFPIGISADPAGKIYVVDPPLHVIKEFTNDLHFLSVWGQFGDGPGQWIGPIDLDVVIPDFAGFTHYVYVVDPHNARIQVYFWEPDVHPTVKVSENYTLPSNSTSLNSTNATFSYGTKNMSTGTTNETRPSEINGTITSEATNIGNIINNINASAIK